MPASQTILDASARRHRCSILLDGVVQGIGFRPMVYRLAARHALGGSVRNCRQGVAIEVEGPMQAVRAFLDDLAAAMPGPGLAARFRPTWDEPVGLAPFAIMGSSDAGLFALSP